MNAAWGLLALVLLPGCKLIDQNTFNPAAGAVPVIPPAPLVAAAVPSGPPPLLVIRPGEPADAAIRGAVAAARQRKPDVLFDVVAMVPDGPTGDDQAAAASTEAGAVARIVSAQGVPSRQVRLLARPEAGLTNREVRIYVR